VVTNRPRTSSPEGIGAYSGHERGQCCQLLPRLVAWVPQGPLPSPCELCHRARVQDLADCAPRRPHHCSEHLSYRCRLRQIGPPRSQSMGPGCQLSGVKCNRLSKVLEDGLVCLPHAVMPHVGVLELQQVSRRLAGLQLLQSRRNIQQGVQSHRAPALKAAPAACQLTTQTIWG
jgi:hypothetical protein